MFGQRSWGEQSRGPPTMHALIAAIFLPAVTTPVGQAINLKLDAGMHTYAISENDQFRPASTSHFEISFPCPPETLVTWCAAELLGVATPHAARVSIRDGMPINPYQEDTLQ